MLKATKYNISETNIANLGSELEKNIRKAAAGGEKAWATAGKAEGLEIWRVEKFKIVSWPKEEYGNFFDGDSYIVLKTYKINNNFAWNIHFWLGDNTTQDEAGTAAYKTVELDDFLNTKPVQYREVMGYESSLFQSYFPNGVSYLSGGIASGFRHVKPEEYKPRLLHLKGQKRVRARQVPISCSSLNEGDVFILDAGLDIYQWNGSNSGPMERAKAAQLSRAIDDGERSGKAEVHVLDHGGSPDDSGELAEFYKLLGGYSKIKTVDEVPSDKIWEEACAKNKRLYKLSDASGKLQFTQVAEGDACTKDKLDSADVFVLDAGSEVICWVGKGASKEERRGALGAAQNYLDTHDDRPNFMPISCVLEGGENEVIKAYMSW